jgi:peptidyl-prolyl cis-trans isomerase D
MALKWLRDNLRHLKFVLWGVVIVFVLLVFVDWGAGRSGGPGAGDEAVRIGDRVVSDQEFVSELRRMNQRFQQQFGEQWNEIRSQVDLAGQTVAYFVDRELHVAEAVDTGLVVSDEELRESILANPLFQREDGAFVGQEIYERIVRSYFQMHTQEFERRLAEDLLITKLTMMVERGVYVGDYEVEENFRRQREMADFDAVQIRYERFLNEVTIDDGDLEAHYEEHADNYLREEQRAIRYLAVEAARLRRLLPASDEDLMAYYEEHVEDYVLGEQGNARHILIRIPAGADDAQRADAKLHADGVAEIARAGGDFAELAAKHSEDPGSKDSGGDLGWFGRGEMVAEFEEAVFNAKPGEIVGPVESQFGYHVIKVEGFRPERQQPFEEVKEQVKFSFLEGRAAAEAEIRAAALARRIASEQPETEEAWQLIADEDEAVVLNVSPPFNRSAAVPGTGGDTGLSEEVFQAELNGVGGPRAISRGWIVWQLSEILASGVPAFEEVRAEVEQEVRRVEAMKLATDAGVELARQWREGGDPAALAEAVGGTVTPARDHRRGTPVGAIGSTPALEQVIFEAAESEVVGPVSMGDRGVVVAKVEQLILVDQAQLEAESETLRTELAGQRAQQLLRSIVNERRRNTVVTVNNELMARFAPSS